MKKKCLHNDDDDDDDDDNDDDDDDDDDDDYDTSDYNGISNHFKNKQTRLLTDFN